MVEQVQPAPGADPAITTRLLVSTDGRTWAPLSAVAVPSAYSLAIAGDRIIGSDATGSKLYVSSDAGATWIPSGPLLGLVHVQGLNRFKSARVAGPVGFGVGGKTPPRTFLLPTCRRLRGGTARGREVRSEGGGDGKLVTVEGRCMTTSSSPSRPRERRKEADEADKAPKKP